MRFCELQKASGITPWKNATRYCAGPAYYRMCSTDVCCSKQTGSSTPKETITHHFFVSQIGQKTVDAAKICGSAEILLKQKPANIRKWIAQFYYWAFILRWKRMCIAHNNCMSCPSIWATLSALLGNILPDLWLFLHSENQPLSEVK